MNIYPAILTQSKQTVQRQVAAILPIDDIETLHIDIIDGSYIYDRLGTVMDPELGIDLVSLGLIYDVSIGQKQEKTGEKVKIHILMTLTTPGCPLAGVFDKLVKDSLFGLEGIDPDDDVSIELTFDPPWVPDMMTEEARAELDL